jgi:hypothetical protein
VHGQDKYQKTPGLGVEVKPHKLFQLVASAAENMVTACSF